MERSIHLSLGNLAEASVAFVEPVVGPTQIAVHNGEGVRYGICRDWPGEGDVDKIRIGGEEVAVA